MMSIIDLMYNYEASEAQIIRFKTLFKIADCKTVMYSERSVVPNIWCFLGNNIIIANLLKIIYISYFNQD